MRLPAPPQLAAPAAAFALSSLLTLTTLGPIPPAIADVGEDINYRFPPIDRTKKDRCKLLSSAIGQANAARDSLYDLRECKLAGSNAATYDLSGALMAEGDFSKSNFKEAQLSKVWAPGAIFDGADFSNGILDRGYYKGASFVGTKFNNAVLSASTFEGANLKDADFTDAYIGDFDQRKLCKNPTLGGENPDTGAPTRESLGCGGGR